MSNSLEQIFIPEDGFRKKLENNSKILFSGVFGSGKTTFLNEFFTNDSTYSSIHLYPVNYSVVSNKDIFELIKYDILFQLIGRFTEDEFEKVEIPYHLTVLPYLLSKNDLSAKVDFFSSFLVFAGEYGKEFLKIYDKLKKFKVGYDKFHEEFQKDDLKSIKSYLGHKTTEPGHIYEEDFYTELIRTLLGKLRDKEDEKKEIVLVIDDLDRLDPDHLFRLLNIFSANFDFAGNDGDNKFDFDKVILVCDYTNVKSVFEHRYGANADFDGYLNKFYSSIYWFSSSLFIKKIIHGYLSKIQTELSYNLFESKNRIGGQIIYILEQLLEYNLVNFRELIRFNKKYDLSFARNAKLKRPHTTESILNGHSLNAEHVVCFLLMFFDNTSILLKKLNHAKELEIQKGHDPFDGDGKDKMADLLLLLNYSAFQAGDFNNDSKNLVEIYYKDYVFECSPIKRNYNISVKCKRVLKNGMEVSTEGISYFDILRETVVLYRDYLKEFLPM